MAEGVGFEPTRPVAGSAGFQDRCLQPLGHPSATNTILSQTLQINKENRQDSLHRYVFADMASISGIISLRGERMQKNESAATKRPESSEEKPAGISRLSNTGNKRADTGGVAWEASEYIHQHKGFRWYALYTAAIAVIIVLVNLFPGGGGIYITLFILIVGIAFGIYANRPPQTVRYSVSPDGISIGSKVYRYDDFKSFSVVSEGGMNSILLTPVARFSPPLTIYYSPDDEQHIIDILSLNLPFEEHSPDLIERIMRAIKF